MQFDTGFLSILAAHRNLAPFLFANNSIIGNPTKELCNLIY
ncbi:hypothetical protein BIFADO_01926 [Bifidobacterium adolescentis L2-32]|uniref:Uncharacterized protein n=1 Tax=Bifidobacterium adolescentis L2-32 TaxID=411481 RepID=A7A7T7_BIFAD|nr:hypothetical protein BIFADO_01926 [Bifidobacterium adolescentis L2-32]